MTDKLYSYHIKGLLERPDRSIGAFRTEVCSLEKFKIVDVPATVLDKETLAFLKFRSMVCEYMDISKLPIPIVNRVRKSIGYWLDTYVIINL